MIAIAVLVTAALVIAFFAFVAGAIWTIGAHCANWENFINGARVGVKLGAWCCAGIAVVVGFGWLLDEVWALAVAS